MPIKDLKADIRYSATEGPDGVVRGRAAVTAGGKTVITPLRVTPPRTHALKTWPVVMDALLTRAKSFDVRRDDRGYRVGDMLIQREWDPATGDYTGRSMRAMITYLLPGGQFGIEAGYVCMSIRRLP